jgi:trk system potassium uptake protein TrkH
MEVKLFSFLTIGGISSIFFFITLGSYGGLGKEVRVAVFEAITALTTTGYSTVGYSAWDAKGIYVIVLLMLIGGGICSTAGGLKQYRVAILIKAIFWELQRMMLPKRAVVTHRAMVGDEESIVTERQIMEIGVYVFLYLITLVLGTGILSICGYSLSDSIFEFSSALGTVGLSLGLTSVSTPPLALWTMSAGMLLGRLEFFVIFISLARLFRKR